MADNKYLGLRMLWWYLIYGGVFVVILILCSLIVFLGDNSWWWVGVPAIISVIGLIIMSIIFLVMSLSRSVPIVTKQDPELIKDKVIEAIKRDEENPDNFIVENYVIRHEGNPQGKKTQIMHLWGDGYESGDRIDVIINMENDKLEMSRLTASTEEKVNEAIRKAAEDPEIEVVSKKIFGFDTFGRAREETETRTPLSKTEKEVKEQQENADAHAAY